MTDLITMATRLPFQSSHVPVGTDQMGRQMARLASFCAMTQCEDSHPILMAGAGLFYTGTTDTVQCYSCSMSFSNWHAQGLNPIELHRQNASDCAHLQGVDSTDVPIPTLDANAHDCIKDMLRQKWTELERNPSLVFPRVQQMFDQACNAASRTVNGDTGESDDYRLPANSDTVPVSSQQDIPPFAAPSAHTWHDPDDVSESTLEAPEVLSNPEIDLELCKTSVTERLKTFEHWPMPTQIHPADLAQAGFVYTGPLDRVQCVFCEGSLRNWQAGDVPSVEHQRHFPACIMARGGQPGTPTHFLRSDRRRTSSPLLVPSGSGVHNTIADGPAPRDGGSLSARETTPTGIVTERPKHGGMAIEAARISSFRNWPPGKTQTPQQLAKAGFFYAGFNDSVKCFFCDGGLRNWEREDDPWHEHARWFPRCKYVRQVKGDHFVEQVLSEEGGKVPQSATYEGDAQGNLRAVRREHTRSGSTGREPENQRVVEPREVTARMDSPIVQAVLNMDVPPEMVRRAIEHRLQNTGDDFPSMEALLEMVFALSSDHRGDSRHPGGSEEGSRSAASSEDVSGEMRVGPGEAPRSLIEENRQLKEQRTCKICMDEEVCVVFVPCGHLVCCATCAPPLSKCPICRSTIRGTVRTYMS